MSSNLWAFGKAGRWLGQWRPHNVLRYY